MHHAIGLLPHRLRADKTTTPLQRRIAQRPFRLLLQLCLLLGLSLAMLSPRQAHAMSAGEAADAAIDIVSAVAGLPISSDQVHIVKDVVACGVNGASAGDCAKNIVVAQVLKQAGVNSPEAADAVNCLVGGGNAGDCLKKAGVAALPEEARPLATCVIDGGNVAGCTAKAAVAQILPKVTGAGVPPAVVDTVNCVIGGKSLEQCGKDLAKSCVGSGPALQSCIANTVASQVQNPQAAEMVKCLGKSGSEAQACASKVGQQVLGPNEQKQLEEVNKVFATLDKVKASSEAQSDPRAFPQQPLAMTNIVKIAQGIRDGDIGTVLLYGGSLIAQAASRIIINYFLPGMAGILGPVADMMILNNVIGLQEGFTAIKNGDAVGLAEAGAKWYATTYIVPACGLMPEGKVKEITCGTVAKAIGTVVDAAGDVAKAILNLGKEFLEAIGLWNAVDGAATAIWNGVTGAIGAITGAIGDLFSGDDPPPLPPAISPAEYFAKNMASACLGKAAARTLAGGKADTSGIVKDCTDYYEPYMVFRPLAEAQCKKLADGLSAMAQATSDNLLAAARAVTTAGGPIMFAQKIYDENRKAEDHSGSRNMCSPTFWTDFAGEYMSFCVGQIDRDGSKYPASMRNASTPNTCSMPTSSDPMRVACQIALREYKDKYLWAGRTAQDSAYCKKQTKDDQIAEALNPCRITETKKVDAGGKTIELPRKVDCDRRITFPGPLQLDTVDLRAPRIPQRPDIGHGVDVINYRPGKDFSPVPFPLDPPRLQIPRWPSIGVPNLPQFPRPVPPSASKGPPKGSGGAGSKNGGTGGYYLSRPIPKEEQQPRVGARAPAPFGNGPGSGGAYTSRPTGNSAMDRLGGLNTGSGISGVAGNSGGVSLQRPLPRPPVTPPSGQLAGKPPPPSQGSGGPSYVDGRSGNAGTKSGGSGGAYYVDGRTGNAGSKSGGGSSPPAQSRPQPPPSGGFDPMINYGGCSSCNTPKYPVVR